MGYTEKDGRLYDQNGSDMGPAKARLDSDRTAIGETRVIEHFPGSNPDLVCRDGRFSLARFPEHEDRNGKRIPLDSSDARCLEDGAERKRFAKIRAMFEAETKQIEQDKIDAPRWVLSLIEQQIEIYLAQSKRLTGHAFVRNAIHLSALLKGKFALEKAFAKPSEEHDCMLDDCPIGQSCDRNG